MYNDKHIYHESSIMISHSLSIPLHLSNTHEHSYQISVLFNLRFFLSITVALLKVCCMGSDERSNVELHVHNAYFLQMVCLRV